MSSSPPHSIRRSLALLAGLASLVWFLVRVIPKPSRAAYPCQRAAFPLASGFVLWVAALAGARTAHRRASARGRSGRWALALAGLALAAAIVSLPLGVPGDAVAQGPSAAAPFQPSEPVNAPMGVGKGIHPGRVAWVRDPEATSWDGVNGNWWDDASTSQAAVSRMLSTALQNLTGEKAGREAWQALFRDFNQAHGAGAAGYRPGERIAIKINANQDRSPEWGKAAPAGSGSPSGNRALNGLHSPQLIDALVAELIEAAGVPGEDITIYDATVWRNIGEPIVSRIRAHTGAAYQAVRFVAGNDWGHTGRTAPVADQDNPVRFSKRDVPPAWLPRQLTEARYLINVALLRPHGMAGVTLTAKNHFGSVYFPENGGWVPRALHNYVSRTQPMGSYSPLVDLAGHRHLGGKTLLYMLDGLYTAQHNEGNVFRFASFGDDWASSVLVSQDPVAIDSVGLDILRSEPRATEVRGNADNYLHEAALAAKPPSGTVYDPEGDGRPLASLGVHEHWNNATDRKYSRNLGRKEGIELVAVLPKP